MKQTIWSMAILTTVLLLTQVWIDAARSTGWRPAAAMAAATDPNQKQYAEIRVVDEATGRGVPLVELETVNFIKYVTDNAGRIAFHEPGLMGREIFFTVRSHGYAFPKDGFGIEGLKIIPRPGQATTIKIKRLNLAERLCRLTGEGLYRDTQLLGQPVPFTPSAQPGNVAGQDSIQTAIYRNQVFCFWGDTSRMEYPLGLFRMAGATIPIPDPNDPASDPSHGIAYRYFVDQTGFARAMIPIPDRPEGVVWVTGLSVVPDGQGVEKMAAWYSRRKTLEKELDQGLCVYNDEKELFESVKILPPSETWRHPNGHPVAIEEGGQKWLLFGNPICNVRVPATLAALLDPEQYEAFTCLKADASGKPGEPDLDSEGKPIWRWQKALPPLDSKTEFQLIRSKKIKPEHARFCPADAASPNDRLIIHSCSVRWNPHRQRWILILEQFGGKPSFIGEVWYSEAASPLGPFAKAVKIVTHDRQSFYNVCHLAFLDREGGRIIHFEGTYTNDFSGNPERTPRYNYNQILYRLDLNHPGLRAAWTE